MAMEMVKSIVFPIVQCVAGPIWSQISYIIFYNSNFDKLKTELHKLEEAKGTLQQRVNAAEEKGEVIFEAAQNSLMEAGAAIAEANNFLNDEDNERVGCLNGPFPNLWRIHQLSKKSTEMGKIISEMETKVNMSINMPQISSPPRSQVAFPPSDRGYEALQSRTLITNEIMQKLKDDNMYMIGVYGMGGVGKSTLIEEVAWQAEHGGSFNVVMVATVTRSPEVEKIQDQLADGLCLKLNKMSQRGRARELWDKIKKEEKVLVIMDDIWGKIDLKEVGVPFGDQHEGCKLLLTSRDSNVLKKEMGTQTNFRLDVLSEEESWNLFEKVAGDVVKKYYLKPTALEVANACMGLPLLLVTVGKALKNEEDLFAWKDALSHLTIYDHEEYPSIGNQVVELSYKYLASDTHKSLFLLIGSYGQISVHIEDLLVYGWGLDLFEHVGILADARRKLYKLIYDLKASSLLLEGKSEGIRMHDVIREGAAVLASRVHPVFHMQRRTNLLQWPNIDQLRKLKHIILPLCYISVLPEILECPKLEVLVLCSEDHYLKVPTHFFSRTGDLKVLDLGGMMCTPSLPQSLGLLKKLKALYLYKCMLEDITIVSQLEGLDILNLEGSEIQELPEEIGKLTHLRLLNLDNCTKLRIIPINVIASLTSLEELRMGNCYIQWEVEGSKQCNNASLSELRQLNHLKSLHLHIRDISNMPRELLVFGKLEKYKILVGDGWKWCWGYAGYSETSRTLKLNLSSTTVTYLDVGIQMLLSGVEDLSLAEVKGARNVLPEFNMEGFAQLKHLLIQNSVEILYIIDSTKQVLPFQTFLSLESLVIRNLINLEKIYYGKLTINVFINLQVVKVKGCDKLENLFSFSMATHLPRLLEIEVSDCKFMTGVIVQQRDEEFEDHDQINLPKIHSIKLESLPNLISFSSMHWTKDIQSGTSLAKHKDDLSNPLILFSNKVAMPNLETLSLSSIDTLKLWDDILIPPCIQNLTHLTVDSCGGLKYLFSSSVVISLEKLRYLKITKCQMMEDIFVNLQSALNPLTQEKVKFPSLETLVVSHMDNLKSIYNDELASNPFPKLIKMDISFCQDLLSVFPSYVLNNLCTLETLVVNDCAALKVVFETQGLYNVSMELLQLQVLHIDHCRVESIVSNSEMGEEDPRFVFPKVTSLTFWNLKELESFYPGIYTLDCPSLKTLDVYHCNQLEIFQSKSQNFQEVVRFHGQPLFSSLKAIPRIHELSLCSKDIANICNDDDLYAVKSLILQCFHDELDTFPIGFLQRFTNLENLTVTCSKFTEILSSENVGPIMKLKTLNLEGLSELEHLCKGNPEIHPILHNIETLKLILCPGLTNVVPSSSSQQFQNLVELCIYSCSGLVNIITSAAARSLLKLKTLVISNCKMVEEIVAREDDSDGSEIAFKKLEHLELENLSTLTSFCKDNFIFKFPLLQTLFVIECPRMETFSHGILIAPKLRKVQVTKEANEDWHWEGELNTTIRKMFDEGVSECEMDI
ncbi:putative winged helix-turn-helix DNA-binding domain, leucine-rich repeat domain, L [Lupinus albus]|uniref:Putative winged helix-turn-helix DNA-binding domain, leucine-rich repeat domain, L n=1 Tax=Lupinus albus TaxID=3870 RepID=A0A6A4QUD2_LUPAL|nr:putative winged helix-turn-helix DNA-binding domain, leucine-rich repeat domain, L [Lupinus albus]